MADRTESIVLDFEVDMEDSIESIDSLTKSSKALREERKKLDTQSVEGKKRIQEINTQLEANTAKIKSNVSALEQQRLNVGNYKSALDNVIPGLSGFIDKGEQGAKTVQKLTLAQKLLLGPLGLIIIAFTALVKWFTSTEEGGDKLAIIMAKVGAVVNVLSDRFTQLGGAIANFSWEGIKNAFSGVGEEMQKEVDAATDLAERLDILDDLNLALNVKMSEQENKIKNLIIQSKNRSLSEEERMKKLVEAAEIEKQLTGEAIALRVAGIHAIATEIQSRNSSREAAQREGETTLEFAKRLFANEEILFKEREKIAEQLKQYNSLLGNQANVQEKIQNQQDAISDKIAENAKKRADALKEEEALLRANARAQSEIVKSTIKGVQSEDRGDPLIDAFETRANVMIDIEDRMQDDLKKRKDAAARQDKDRAEKGLEIQKTVEEQKLQAAAGVAAGIAGLLDQQSDAYKAFASAQVVISTYAAATKAYEAAFLPIPTVASPALGVAFAAAAVLQGIANLAKINGVEFAEGGWTGPGHKMKAVGVVHANEYVTPSWLVNSKQAQPHLMALEGMRNRGYVDGGLVSNSITQPINQQLELSNIFKNMPPMELSVKEVTKIQKRVKVKEQISKR